MFHSSEKFEEWFSLGDGGKEKEAEVVQQLHKVNVLNYFPGLRASRGYVVKERV